MIKSNVYFKNTFERVLSIDDFLVASGGVRVIAHYFRPGHAAVRVDVKVDIVNKKHVYNNGDCDSGWRASYRIEAYDKEGKLYDVMENCSRLFQDQS